MARSRARARLNWVSQGQRWGRCRVRRRAERVSRPAREKNRRLQGLGGYHLFAQTNPRRPAGEVMRHHLDRQPGAVGGETPRRHVVQPDAVLEVAYGVLDLGVAAMIGLQLQRLPIAVGDEAVIAVGGEEGELGTGRRLHPPDNEPHRRGVRLGLERGVSRLGNIGGAVHPVWDGRPVRLGYGLDQVPQAFVLADGDGEAHVQLAADGYHAMGVEAAVGPHRELPAGPSVAHPPHRFTQEVGGATSGVGPALAQPAHQHVAGSGGDSQQRVIAPLAGIAVMTCPFLGQTVGLADGGVQVDGQRPVAGSGPGLPRRVPATPGSPGPVGERGPNGSCAGRFPGWMAP